MKKTAEEGLSIREIQHEEKVDSVWIVNITDVPHFKQRTYMRFHIAALEANTMNLLSEDVPYRATEIGPQKDKLRIGDIPAIDIGISARECAEDLCKEINGNQMGTTGEDGNPMQSYSGIFISDTPTPSEKTLRNERQKLINYYNGLVEMGESEFSAHRKMQLIPGVCKRAAKALKLTPEWLYVENKEKTECPACFEKLNPNAAVCKSCGAIINAEKAAQFGLVKKTA